MTEHERLIRAVVIAACNWRNHPQHSFAIKELEDAVDALNTYSIQQPTSDETAAHIAIPIDWTEASLLAFQDLELLLPFDTPGITTADIANQAVQFYAKAVKLRIAGATHQQIADNSINLDRSPE